jgi:hypothetical protein
MQGNYISFEKMPPNRFSAILSFVESIRDSTVNSAAVAVKGRTIRLIAILAGLPLFVFSILALAQWGNGGSCHWALPRWFGCVLSSHEGLAGGLIGASGALIAGWIAWTAVQQQINADRERAMADRVEAELLLSADLADYADGMAAAWRLLANLPEGADAERTRQVYEATAYMATWLSRPEQIANYRAMVEILGWEQRTSYGGLLRGLEELQRFSKPESIDDIDEILSVIRSLSYSFEICLPSTSEYFRGLWRRTPKAYSLAGWISHIGGADLE